MAGGSRVLEFLMGIFPYLTDHTCPKCKMSLVRDPDRSDRLICTICWAAASYDARRDSVSALVRDLLTPQEIEGLRHRFDLPR
jgi:hypothetical protein